MQHMLVFKLTILVQRNVLKALVIIISAYILITLILTQRIVLGVIIVNIDTAAILILVTVTNITLGIMTYGIVTEIVTTIGSIASGSIIFVQGTLGITTTCMEDTTIVKTSPTNSTAIGRPTTPAISSANQWISTPETTTSAKRT